MFEKKNKLSTASGNYFKLQIKIIEINYHGMRIPLIACISDPRKTLKIIPSSTQVYYFI